jgi:hypothetical protein
MRKLVAVLIVCCALALPAHAGGILVHDPIHTVVNQTNWLISEIKQGAAYVLQTEQYVQEKLTALKEVEQVENEIIQLERMGDPKTLTAQLPGVRVITNLAVIYQTGKQDAEDWAGFVNPQNLKITAQEVMGIYNQNGWGSQSGFHASPAQGLVQFSLSDYNTANGAQDSITKLIQKKTDLIAARDSALAAAQAGSTDAEVQKLNITVQTLNASIAAVDAQIQQAVALATVQQQKNQAADKIYRASVTVQSASSFSSEVAGTMDSLASVAPNDLTVPNWQP